MELTRKRHKNEPSLTFLLRNGMWHDTHGAGHTMILSALECVDHDQLRYVLVLVYFRCMVIKFIMDNIAN